MAPPKDQMTLSKAIHEIENMNNLAIMASSILNEVTDKFLKAEELSGKTKEIIEQARHDSAEIESACQRADNLLKWTRRSIYPLINADHVMIDCSVSLEDDSDEQEDFDS